ncbi:MAG: TonB-dependent receptor [Proteobacteria bacterium]|nr:TonB-dependent receptor [Pseudomonadota bacterium]NOG59301.1 TonB-dependent receptor [Pseudomonadota bacterium]
MYISKVLCVFIFLSYLPPALAEHDAVLDDMVITGQQSDNPELRFTNPVSTISAVEAENINVTTIEDFLKYEPGVIVRRRYIGDPNGTVGMRGSNMFQTARTMVYADGLPLHYHLQTQYSGSPRWSLVSPDEATSVETIYGPFSALYSGNAMGGVINIKTRFPEKFEFNAEASSFLQDFEFLGDDDTYFGHKEFVSVGNKFGDLSVYLFHNHLENKSQPMSFFDAATTAIPAGSTGAIIGPDELGNTRAYYGDSGAEEIATDLTKIKLGYDMGDWFTSLTLAYENRDRDADSAKTYLRDATGAEDFSLNSSKFRVSYEERETLLIGGELTGPIASTGWDVTTNFSIFELIKDERLRSNTSLTINPTAGRVREFDDTGWQTFDIKFTSDNLFNKKDMRLSLGYHFDHYQLEVAEYNAVGDFRNGVKGTIRNNNPSAGQTLTHAVFSEYGWEFYPLWDVVLGARYEMWQSKDGQKGTDFFADRTEDEFSPKFALGFNPDGPWSFRYSLARAYRFPLVEELFENEDDTLGTTIANEKLKQEDGVHHNFSIHHEIPDGLISLNLYYEIIDDVIFNQTEPTTNTTTFLNIDEVTTKGAEFSYNQSSVFNIPLDIRSNIAYTNAEVTKNRFDPTIVGKQFPRLPKWRVNLLATYHLTSKWDFSTGLKYASNSFGQLDNSDIADNVFAAQDEYLFVNVKTKYEVNDIVKLSAGVENINNEKAFVHHPWPQRTYFVEGKLSF